MNNWFSKKYLLVALLSVFLSVPAVTIAAVSKDKAQDNSMTITISDLDLSKEAGIESLYQRLKINVSKVCGEKDTHVTGSRIASSKIKKRHKKCSIEAMDRVVKSIDNEKLTKLHSRPNI